MLTSTFIMLKPDAVKRGLTNTIIQIFQENGYQIKRQKEVVVDRNLILKHYEEVIIRVNKPYFEQAILDFFDGQKVIALELQKEGDHVIEDVRALVGATDPAKADPSSIRGRYGEDSLEASMSQKRTLRNLIHASDSVESAKQELSLWFN
jgi:nucleoside-diphosphate kinase